jgi:hypothetical protein
VAKILFTLQARVEELGGQNESGPEDQTAQRCGDHAQRASGRYGRLRRRRERGKVKRRVGACTQRAQLLQLRLECLGRILLPGAESGDLGREPRYDVVEECVQAHRPLDDRGPHKAVRESCRE